MVSRARGQRRLVCDARGACYSARLSCWVQLLS